MATAEKINEMNKRNIPFSPPDISELEIAERLQKHYVLDGLQQVQEQKN